MVETELKLTVMAVIKIKRKEEKREGYIWAKSRLWLETNLGLFGLFIIKRITMIWLRYLYLLGPWLKYKLTIGEFHSLFDYYIEIDRRYLFTQSSYNLLVSNMRNYLHDQDFPDRIKFRKSQPNFLLKIILLFRSLFPLFNVVPVLNESEIAQIRSSINLSK